MLIVTQADDLLGEEESVNLPGTDRERPNWRRRLVADIDAIFRGPAPTPEAPSQSTLP